MSQRLSVLDCLMRVAKKLEATELYAVLADGTDYDWVDPIHVRPGRDPQGLRDKALRAFEEIAKQSPPDGGAILVDAAPTEKWCLTLPVWIADKRAAIACWIVTADDRASRLMLELARLMLKDLNRPGRAADE
jgi:hypothetical protein